LNEIGIPVCHSQQDKNLGDKLFVGVLYFHLHVVYRYVLIQHDKEKGLIIPLKLSSNLVPKMVFFFISSVTLPIKDKIHIAPPSKAPSKLSQRNLKMQQSPAILDLCLKKTRARKSRDYRDVIVFEKLFFQIVFRPH